jgi:hypothetical protein
MAHIIYDSQFRPTSEAEPFISSSLLISDSRGWPNSLSLVGVEVEIASLVGGIEELVLKIKEQWGYWLDSGLLRFEGLLMWFSLHRAIRLFQVLLYEDRFFSRSKEAHIRLGLIFKHQSEPKPSLKHFRLALNDTSPSTFTDKQIKFHIAHLNDVLGKGKATKVLYEQLLASGDLGVELKADTYRQLGKYWDILTLAHNVAT